MISNIRDLNAYNQGAIMSVSVEIVNAFIDGDSGGNPLALFWMPIA